LGVFPVRWWWVGLRLRLRLGVMCICMYLSIYLKAPRNLPKPQRRDLSKQCNAHHRSGTLRACTYI
jgi:hypothetical protein